VKAAIGYLRVSTDEQVSGYGLEVQRERIEDFCRREKVDLFHVYEDVLPGATPLAERPGLSDALDAVKTYINPTISSLVVARHDRLARDTTEALLAEREFLLAGCPVLYTDGSNGNEPSLVFLREVLHAAAAFEKRQLVSRLQAARKAKAARGGYAGGRPPFGYEARGGALSPKADEAEVVRWAFARVAKDGWSVRKVATALDREATLGKIWHISFVARLLTRADYKQGPAGARVVDPKIWNRAAAVLAARRPR
jgi:DNA invertase Pin-like site-specific DNA recombinase